MGAGILLYRLIFVFFAVFTVFSSTFAHDIRIGYATDSSDYTETMLDLNLDVGEQTQLYGSASDATIKDSSGDIATNSYSAGISGIANEQLDYDIGYNYWGAENEITTDTWHLSLSLYTQDWKFTFRPENKQITLYTNTTNRRTVDIDGTGFYNSVEYFGLGNLDLRYAHTSYHYDKNLTALNTRIVQLFFSNASLLLSGGLIEKKDDFEVTTYLGDARIALTYSQVLTAVDKSHSDTWALNLDYALTKTVSVELEAGSVNPEAGSSVNFGSAALRYKF